MGFWNFFGLSSKKDSEALEIKLDKLQEILMNEIQQRHGEIEATTQKSVCHAEELNSKIIASLHELEDSLKATVLDGSSDINEILSTQVKQFKKLEPLIKQSHGYIFETLNLQNQQLQQLEAKIQYLEKLNEELVKSMQAVWLVQLSKQIDSEFSDK